MIRKHFSNLTKPGNDRIVWRSHEPTRIEAFSDAVFAFGISLLVFSLEVPKSSEELLNGLLFFIPFIFCFGSIFYFWYEQYIFFRRYGLHDILTILLNGALISVVLFYIYPLKFLFSFWIIRGPYTIRIADIIPLIVVYNGGLSLIYFLLAMMYYNAYTKRQELKLTPGEIFLTKSHLYTHLFPTFIGIAIVLFALLGGKYAVAAMGGWALMGVKNIFDARRNKLFKMQFGNTPMTEPNLGAEG